MLHAGVDDILSFKQRFRVLEAVFGFVHAGVPCFFSVRGGLSFGAFGPCGLTVKVKARVQVGPYNIVILCQRQLHEDQHLRGCAEGALN